MTRETYPAWALGNKGARQEWQSRQDCCTGCWNEESEGYPFEGDACCCTHANEWAELMKVARAELKEEA